MDNPAVMSSWQAEKTGYNMAFPEKELQQI